MTNSDTFQFTEVNLAGIGPFDGSAYFSVKAWLTVVLGSNAAGKTILFNALEEQYRLAKNAQLPEWLIFLSGNFRYPYGGGTWEPLNEFLDSHLGKAIDLELFKTNASANINQLLWDKVRGSSKFSNFSKPDDVLPLFTVELTEERVLIVRESESGADKSSYFQSMGETMVLYLAIVKAIRDSLGGQWDVPFVADGYLAQIDHMLLRQAVRFVTMMSGQVILLVNERELEVLGLPPNYELFYDSATKKTSVWLTNT